ncbi:MAG: acyl-CoA thioesterase [Pseudomonadales bacterium]|nr:acyl-CoA thioesterase [Pseudomonadales bacterium]
MDLTSHRTPQGRLSLQTIAMPADTNWNGDIFGGWLLSQMDLAGSVCARQRSLGRVATVAIDSMAFLTPVRVGDVISCYSYVVRSGRSSMLIAIEVWETSDRQQPERILTEGRFTYVAIDEQGHPRALPTDIPLTGEAVISGKSG